MRPLSSSVNQSQCEWCAAGYLTVLGLLLTGHQNIFYSYHSQLFDHVVLYVGAAVQGSFRQQWLSAGCIESDNYIDEASRLNGPGNQSKEPCYALRSVIEGPESSVFLGFLGRS